MAILLYAEDNEDDVFILSTAIKRSSLPHTLYSVDDGEAAIAWLRGDDQFADRKKHPLPDLLILDLKMPRKSGFDVLKWMNQVDELKAMPVIVLSSSDDPKDMKNATGHKVVGYFKKSANCQEIIDYLKTVR